LTQSCPKGDKRKSPGDQLNGSIKKLPPSVGNELDKELDGGGDTGDNKKKKNCKQAKHPKRCRLKKKLDTGQTLDDLLDELGEQLDEIQDPLDDIIDGGLLP